MSNVLSNLPDLQLESREFGLISGDQIEKFDHQQGEFQSIKTSGWEIVFSDSREGPLIRFYLGINRGTNLLLIPPDFNRSQVEGLAKTLGRFFPEGGEGYAAFLTSGSSGQPKAIVHRHESLVLAANKILSRYPSLESAKFHHLFPSHYMAGILNGLLVPWLGRGGLLLDQVFNFSTPYSLGANIENYKTSAAWVSPTMMKTLTETWRSKKAPPKLWPFVFSATGPLGDQVRDDFDSVFGTQSVNTYGTTELLFISSEKTKSSHVSAGVPFPGVQVALAENLGNEVSQQNSLVVESDTACVAIFSYNEASKSYEPTFWPSEGPVDTKDTASIDKSGLISISQRADDIVVLGGVNYSLAKIESAALAFPGVTACSAFAPFGADVHALHLAFEVNEGNTTFSEPEFAKYLDITLKNSSPRRRTRMALPRTHSGKINRQEVMRVCLEAGS
jgi:cyclohexanecarboxylate-CoA ligase